MTITWTKHVGNAFHEVRMTPIRIRNHAEKAFALAVFGLLKKHITLDWRKAYGGQQIFVDVRILGWKVGEQKILDKRPTPGPTATKNP